MDELLNYTTTEDEENIDNLLDYTFLTFLTDGQLFGIPISVVVQIVGIQSITPIPDFPPYAKGIINLRGNIIPVIDMRIRFGKEELQYNERTCIIVTNINAALIGFIVDAVDEVANIPEENITVSPQISDGMSNRYLTGIGQIKEKVVILLDIQRILTESEFKAVNASTQKAFINSQAG